MGRRRAGHADVGEQAVVELAEMAALAVALVPGGEEGEMSDRAGDEGLEGAMVAAQGGKPGAVTGDMAFRSVDCLGSR